MRYVMFLVFTFFLVSLSPGYVLAGTKIGVLDMQKIISQSEPGKQAMAQLRTKTEKMKKELDKQKKELQTLRNELQKQALVLSQEAKQDKELEFKKKLRDYQDTLLMYQKKIRMEEQKLSKPILNLLVKVIKDYGKKHGFTAIWDMRASGLVFSQDSIDITDQIMAELNKAWQKEHSTSNKTKK